MEDTYNYAEDCHSLWFCFTLMELVGRIDIAAKRNNGYSGTSASTSYDGKTGSLHIEIESPGKKEIFRIHPYRFEWSKITDIKKRLYEILAQAQGKENDMETEKRLCRLHQYERKEQMHKGATL